MRTLVAVHAALTWSFLYGILLADDWPQWRGPSRDGVWHESGIIEKFEAPQIKIRWRTRISSGYSGPTVAEGRVYVSDYVSEPEQVERIHCMDWKTGKTIWTHAYPCDYGSVGFPAGPRACVTIDDGRAFSLGTVGHFHCFDGATGKVLWKKDLVDEYKIRLLTWGIAPAPLVEGNFVILQVGGAGGACIVAFDKRTGDERWKALDEPTSYSSPIVIEQAGRRVLVCWTGASVSGLDPDTGTVYWRHAWGHDGGWIDPIASPAFDSNRLFVSCTQHGARMLKLHPDELKVELVWEYAGPARRRGKSLHAVISTPWLAGDFLYGIDYFGQLRCLDANTGEQVWEDRTATSQVIWGMGHLVRNGQKTWILNDRGELIVSRLSARGFEQISRAKLLEPTREQFRRRSGVCWSHPAFAYKHVFARNDEEVVCASLAADEPPADALAHGRTSSAPSGKEPMVSKAPPPLVPPFTAEQIKGSQQAWAHHLGMPVEYANLLGMKCVLIPPGEFHMGSTEAATNRLSQEATAHKMPEWYMSRLSDERPQHRVRITRPFYMSQYEVTVGQFRSFLSWGDYHPDKVEDGRNGWGLNSATGKLESGAQYTWENPGFPQTDQHPVVNVSWNDAVAYCEYLQSAEGDECRLPTEAEWEYACRLGMTASSASAANPRSLRERANVADVSLGRKWPEVATGSTSAWDDGHPFTAPVGQFKPDTLGLFDMRGNAGEWCQDWHDRKYYERSPQSDPMGPDSGSLRVHRGGSWSQPSPACRSAFRNARSPSDRHATVGFRVIQVW
ncbi:MAG: SUMF1/EgtB/PvdO family nonheme iron enzyme [Planctomycetes bacterium]|nr:SUMF1/EgtB/PvdO family nonheme iron enzyme [Planctomycetota bacterium]MBL7039801.1 SUMF1/EgtB/PvdO family nonheme iron enzyme [Pirellulaceae bacterium]